MSTSVDFTALDSPEIFEIVMLLARYEEVITLAVEKNEPATITNHLFEIARLTNAANHSLRVKDKDPRIAESRMVRDLKMNDIEMARMYLMILSFLFFLSQLLLWCVRSVIGNGLRILGLEPLEEM